MDTKKIKRTGIGKKSSQLLSELAAKNKAIFTFGEARALLKEKKPATAKLLHDLVRNGWLFRIAKGIYMILPLEAGAKPEFTEHEFAIASSMAGEGYISYWSALNYYGFTEQVPKTVFVAITRRKKEKEVLGLRIRFVCIKKKKFFGFKKICINNIHVRIAEKEKAIIDCLDLPRNCGGISEAVKAISGAKDEIDSKKMEMYAKRMGNNAVINRLGYIFELLGIKTALKPGKHPALLEPEAGTKGRYNQKWNIIENVPKKELLSWREH
ncbi:MAG: type IV toxin-antitoxin system AbiEi family antitoxin domain-containing protein [Nanoarchaeota archaeon]